MGKKIALIFIIILLLGAVGVVKIINDSSTNITENQNPSGISGNNQIHQQNTPPVPQNSPSVTNNISTPSGGNEGKIILNDNKSSLSASSDSKFDDK